MDWRAVRAPGTGPGGKTSSLRPPLRAALGARPRPFCLPTVLVAPAPLPAVGLPAALLDVSLNGVILFRPVFDPADPTIVQRTDFTRLRQAHAQAAEAGSLAAVVEPVRLDLGTALAEAEAELHVDLAGCPTVSFAPKNLRSIVYNLLSNAVKHRHPARPPVVRLRARRTAAVLEVQDSGPSLDAGQRALHGAENRGQRGRHHRRSQRARRGHHLHRFPAGLSPRAFPMQKLPTILLVDDDPTTNFLNELLLKNLDVTERLLVAENGAQALEMLHEACATPEGPTCPVLVLLDVNMPVMNGIEFLEAYHLLPLAWRQAVVIVMLTTSLHSRDLTRLQELAIAGLVSKPLTRAKIDTILQANFQRALPMR